MGSSKSPQEKKALSLKKDRRNAYGENDKASRKNIPASKQRSRKAERLVQNQPLLALHGQVDEDVALAVVSDVKDRVIAKRHVSFKKTPDVPLGIFLKRNRIYGKQSSNSKNSAGLP